MGELVWCLENKTTKMRLKSNSLKHIAQQVDRLYGVKELPLADIILEGKCTFTVVNESGNLEVIVIKELEHW